MWDKQPTQVFVIQILDPNEEGGFNFHFHHLIQLWFITAVQSFLTLCT